MSARFDNTSTSNMWRVFHVTVEPDEGCYFATSPDAPGWLATAPTREECVELVFESLRFYVNDDTLSLQVIYRYPELPSCDWPSGG